MVNRRVLHVFFSCMVLFLLLSCQLFSPLAVSTPMPEVATLPSPLDDPNIEDIANTEEALLPQIVPTRTAISEEVGEIQVDYVYTDGLVTSLYHLYGSYLDHFVDISLTNHSPDPATIIIETYIEGYSTKSTDTVDVGAGEQVEVHQDPRLTPDAVDQLNSEQPGNFRIRVVQIVDGEEKVLVDESQQILMYSRRDFVWIDGFETNEEYELWAAWVTPTDPGVEALIRAAADYMDSGIMTSGYGGIENDDDGKVWKRLEAIWKAEKENYHLTYISTMVAFGPNTVQRMRLPAEVLDQSSGNCVELAALYASAAEALGLETAIIRIPGHAYTAVRMDEVNANYYFIETTMIGQSDFTDAVNVGKEEWNDAIPHFDANEEGYAWVTIQDAREKGILPIPWK
ncbi:MAG: hypothetical protein IH586_14110 [Anaerolineaceae bacterium]|nr:hypothetical protein [Anaerolineaceae bacterium]